MNPIYIIDQDYENFIQTDVLDDIVLSDTSKLRITEQMAIDEMIADLNVRFDISGMFPASNLWKAPFTYRPRDYVEDDDIYYIALLQADEDADPNQGLKPVDNPTYWRAATFPKIFSWNEEDQFPEGRYVVDEGEFYLSQSNNTGDKPKDNLVGADSGNETWILEDPREPLLVRYACEISLYISHSRLPAKKIPQLRIDNYDLAKKFLKECASGKKQPLWPLLPEDDTSKDIVRYGGKEFKDYLIP